MASKVENLRKVPQSIEAEKAVLGCMLINPDAVPRAINILTARSPIAKVTQGIPVA